MTSGKADASFLEQLRLGELAAGRKLATDHSNEPEIGSDESLSRHVSQVLEDLQFHIGRIGKTGA